MILLPLHDTLLLNRLCWNRSNHLSLLSHTLLPSMWAKPLQVTWLPKNVTILTMLPNVPHLPTPMAHHFILLNLLLLAPL